MSSEDKIEEVDTKDMKTIDNGQGPEMQVTIKSSDTFGTSMDGVGNSDALKTLKSDLENSNPNKPKTGKRES